MYECKCLRYMLAVGCGYTNVNVLDITVVVNGSCMGYISI